MYYKYIYFRFMKIYKIPKNFAQEGLILGFIKIRNFLETVVAVLVLSIIIFGIVDAPPKVKVYLSLFLLLPIGAACVIGVNGLSLGTFISNVIKYKKDTNIYSYPTAKDKITREKNIAKKKEIELKRQAKEDKKNKVKINETKIKISNKKEKKLRGDR